LSFSLGALVVAHSLRDGGTTKNLAVLITEDTVSLDAIAQLRVSNPLPGKHAYSNTNCPCQTVYDFIIPVDRIVTPSPANLFLMNRTDLHSTFTKINLWKLVQFRKIVYVDADMVSIRAPDELFELPHAFSAAPDIGWPDIFNSGLMVLTPNMADYYALLAMAQRGISFDGADQGLLNMHFKNTFNRLSFTYNVTPSAHYQYLPAYRHFQSTISMGHFIGHDKPWTQGREANRGSNPYGEMVGRWWAVYDRHYKESVSLVPEPGNK
jgi:glycogenin glucosyltransferase